VTPQISVVLSTYNPHLGRLRRALDGLLAQSLPADQAEIVLVDNASTPPLHLADLQPVSPSRIALIREDRLGLVFGRMAGIRHSRGPLLVFVDDDNVIAPNYLDAARAIFERFPRLGLAGGKSLPEWEAETPGVWVKEFYDSLALRDLGDDEQTASATDPPTYPGCAPIGAGMVARREAINNWVNNQTTSTITGRKGDDLSSAEDCDIVMSVLGKGLQVGYFPQLVLRHLIPAHRVTPAHLARLNQGIAKSWVRVLDLHGINPWPPAAPWTVPLRKARAYLRYRAWHGASEYVRWKAACGQFEGRAAINAKVKRVSARQSPSES
jgi:glycosyltransferase involved in cell wall biosynthesis